MRMMWFVQPALVALADAGAATDAGTGTGLGLSGIRNTSSDEQFAALADDSVDMAVTAMDNVFAWNQRPGPRDFRIVAQVEGTTPLHLIGQAGLGSLDALRGGTILVDAPHNGFVIALRALLADAGLVADDYRLAPVGGVTERFEALLAGQGQATLLGPPFDAMALAAGRRQLASVQDRYHEFPGQGLVMRQAALPRLAGPARELLRTLAEACRQMTQAPEQAARQLAAAGLPPAAIPGLVATPPALSLRPDPAGVNLLIQHRRRLGLPGGDETYGGLVDDSLLPAAPLGS